MAGTARPPDPVLRRHDVDRRDRCRHGHRCRWQTRGQRPAGSHRRPDLAHRCSRDPATTNQAVDQAPSSSASRTASRPARHRAIRSSKQPASVSEPVTFSRSSRVAPVHDRQEPAVERRDTPAPTGHPDLAQSYQPSPQHHPSPAPAHPEPGSSTFTTLRVNSATTKPPKRRFVGCHTCGQGPHWADGELYHLVNRPRPCSPTGRDRGLKNLVSVGSSPTGGTDMWSLVWAQIDLPAR